MNAHSFVIRQPFYHNKKLPVGLLHFTAGFLLLSAFLESESAGYPRGLAIGFLILGLFEIAYTVFAARLQRSYPAVGALIRIITALAFLLYALQLLSTGQLFFGIGMILVSLAFVMILLVERRWSKPFVLKIDEKGVWFPRFFKYQLFPWEDLRLVILRGNVITLDFINNRVAQLEVKTAYQEEETKGFNEFCRLRLQKATPV